MASRRSTSTRPRSTRSAAGPSGLAEQLVERILKPLGLVVLSRERIRETLEEAAERGRVTRSDANELTALLVQRGRQQTDELVERLVRGADRARRTVGVGPTFPIIGYDDLTAVQIRRRLDSLNRSELRKVRSYEQRHAKRKSILTRIEKLLG